MPLHAADAASEPELPDFLVKNRDLYGILSKGIHELSEDECLSYFDPVKAALELILDQALEKKRGTRRKHPPKRRSEARQAQWFVGRLEETSSTQPLNMGIGARHIWTRRLARQHGWSPCFRDRRNRVPAHGN